MTKKQYRTPKVSVGTVKKSIAAIASRWFRRNVSQRFVEFEVFGTWRSQRETVASARSNPSFSSSPQLLEIGPERMFERAKANGLVIPMVRYKIYVLGASPAGLTPKSWMTMKIFWKMYFRAAGAELVAYSTDCNVQR